MIGRYCGSTIYTIDTTGTFLTQTQPKVIHPISRDSTGLTHTPTNTPYNTPYQRSLSTHPSIKTPYQHTHSYPSHPLSPIYHTFQVYSWITTTGPAATLNYVKFNNAASSGGGVNGVTGATTPNNNFELSYYGNGPAYHCGFVSNPATLTAPSMIVTDGVGCMSFFRVFLSCIVVDSLNALCHIFPDTFVSCSLIAILHTFSLTLLQTH